MDLIQQLKAPSFITGFAESRIGGRSENQDYYGSSDTPYGFVVTVCDGMGGGPGGKTASTIAVNEIIMGIKEGNPDDIATNIVLKAIRRANLAIIEAGKKTPNLKGMGSTCTVLLINEESAIVAHVGDSRIYQLRGKNKMFRTFDHSMVFDLVKQKVITEEQARLSAQSNVITRALGIKSDIEIDITELSYDSGDRFLLTTDGVHGAVSELELINMASDKKHALGIVTDEIATIIDGKGRNEGGGHDNLTLAIIETKINSKLRSKMNKKVKLFLIVISLICLLSLIFNIVLLRRNNLFEKDNLSVVHNQVQDSLRNQIIKQDSIIDKLKEERRTNQSEIVKENSTLNTQIEVLEQEKLNLEEQLKNKSDENKKLQDKIDELEKNKENKN